MKPRRRQSAVREKIFEGLRYLFFTAYLALLAGLVYGVWHLKHAEPPAPVMPERSAAAPEVLPVPESSPVFSPAAEAVPESPVPLPSSEETHAV